MKYEVPSGDPKIVKHEIPSGDLKQLGIPSGDSFYSTSKYEVPSGDLHRNMRSLLATFIEIRDPFWRSLLTKQFGILSDDSLLLIVIDVVLPAGRI